MLVALPQLKADDGDDFTFTHEGQTLTYTVKLVGGDLTVNYTDEKVTLTGSAVKVYEGEFEY